MQSTIVRVSQETHALLRNMSKQTGETMQRILEHAVADHYKALFWQETNAAFAALKTDAGAWTDALVERKSWDDTLSDGMKD